MSQRRHLVVCLVVLAACTGEPGGGGVNIPDSTIAPAAGSTTSSTTATTTTTTPATTSSTTSTTTTAATTTTLPTYQVSGRVADREGTPVPRAFVTMGDTRSVTGPDGWFSFATQAPKTMRVSKPGWTRTKLAWKDSTTFYEATIDPKTIRGLRVAAESAASDGAFEDLLRLADKTAVNALVFDTKRESGEILYDTKVKGARKIGAVNVVYDPAKRIAQAHEHDLYAITRIAAFEDDIRSAAIPDEHLAGTWLDPTSKTARSYVIALAEEACELGFDEIQFDYVRYPAGRTADVSGQRELTQKQRVATISSFLQQARNRLHPMGCTVSAAVFGIIVSSPDDQGLGQRPEEISAQVDVLSPMVYPSHYSPGWLGFEEPNDHPYAVVADAISDATSRMRDGSQLRPYLQAFWWTNGQIRSSIQAAEDAGVGWILWNIVSDYDAASLPTDEELSG